MVEICLDSAITRGSRPGYQTKKPVRSCFSYAWGPFRTLFKTGTNGEKVCTSRGYHRKWKSSSFSVTDLKMEIQYIYQQFLIRSIHHWSPLESIFHFTWELQWPLYLTTELVSYEFPLPVMNKANRSTMCKVSLTSMYLEEKLPSVLALQKVHATINQVCNLSHLILYDRIQVLLSFDDWQPNRWEETLKKKET